MNKKTTTTSENNKPVVNTDSVVWRVTKGTRPGISVYTKGNPNEQ